MSFFASLTQLHTANYAAAAASFCMSIQQEAQSPKWQANSGLIDDKVAPFYFQLLHLATSCPHSAWPSLLPMVGGRQTAKQLILCSEEDKKEDRKERRKEGREDGKKKGRKEDRMDCASSCSAQFWYLLKSGFDLIGRQIFHQPITNNAFLRFIHDATEANYSTSCLQQKWFYII